VARLAVFQVVRSLSEIDIRKATANDASAVWHILKPMIRAGEAYALPIDLSEQEALAYWFAPAHEVFVAQAGGVVVGTFFLRANQRGGGSHVANCGFVTSVDFGGRGVARAMCCHALAVARNRGFTAMQFNFVVATNTRAVRLWQDLGFEVVGRLPNAFAHPRLGFVDSLVMFRQLDA
jgi:ribosomal protein S18 acetylase RimI-like enzyme